MYFLDYSFYSNTCFWILAIARECLMTSSVVVFNLYSGDSFIIVAVLQVLVLSIFFSFSSFSFYKSVFCEFVWVYFSSHILIFDCLYAIEFMSCLLLIIVCVCVCVC